MSDGNGNGEASVSVGQEDQAIEREMETQQRWEDEGVGVPPVANPHSQINRTDRTVLAPAQKDPAPQSPRNEDHQPWKAREDDPDQPGATPDGGLGGSGPVQP